MQTFLAGRVETKPKHCNLASSLKHKTGTWKEVSSRSILVSDDGMKAGHLNAWTVCKPANLTPCRNNNSEAEVQGSNRTSKRVTSSRKRCCVHLTQALGLHILDSPRTLASLSLNPLHDQHQNLSPSPIALNLALHYILLAVARRTRSFKKSLTAGLRLPCLNSAVRIRFAICLKRFLRFWCACAHGYIYIYVYGTPAMDLPFLAVSSTFNRVCSLKMIEIHKFR